MRFSAGAHALLVVALLFSTARAQDGGLDPSQLQAGDEIVRKNEFNTDRRYGEYQLFFPGTLEADIATWTKDMRILDGGAGSAAFLGEVVARANADARPEAIAVAVSRPEMGWKDPTKRPVPEGVTYIEGYLGDAASDFELEKRIGLGTIDRIVEVYGASHYSPSFDRVLEGYGRLLKPGGKLYLHIDPLTTILDADGRPLSAASYLRRVKGLKIVDSRATLDPRGIDRPQLVVVLERTNASLSVPRLELRSFKKGGPPERIYASSLAPFEAPEDGALRVLAAGADADASLRWRGFVLPFKARKPSKNAAVRELVVSSRGEVVTYELASTERSQGYPPLYDAALSRESLEKLAERLEGSVDKIIHDARTGDPNALLESFSKLLKTDGRVVLLVPEGTEVKTPEGLKEWIRYMPAGGTAERVELVRGERTGIIDRLVERAPARDRTRGR